MNMLLSCEIKPGLFADERVVVVGSRTDPQSFFVEASVVDEEESALRVIVKQAEDGRYLALFRSEGYLTQIPVERSALH